METKVLHMESWIRFGKYRKRGKRLCDIIETEDGRKWLNWLISKSEYNTDPIYSISPIVEEKLKAIENERSLLRT